MSKIIQFPIECGTMLYQSADLHYSAGMGKSGRSVSITQGPRLNVIFNPSNKIEVIHEHAAGQLIYFIESFLESFPVPDS